VRRIVSLALVIGIAPIFWGAHASAAGRAVRLTVSNQYALGVQEFAADGANGRIWNSYNLTQAGGGPAILGTPSAVINGTNGSIHMYATGSNGDLVEYVNDGQNGRVWNAYDLSLSTGSGPVAPGPAATYDPTAQRVQIMATGSNGHLIEFVNDGIGGRAWNAYDLSAVAGGGGGVVGTPNIFVAKSLLEVFVRASNGDLVEYVNDGAGGHLWNVYDLSAVSGGGPIVGTPTTISLSSTLHVYAQSWTGDLLEFVNTGGANAWSAYDLSAVTGAGRIVGSPSAIVFASSGTVHVYAQNSNGDLVEFASDGLGGRVWNAYDLSVDAGGGRFVGGSPDVVFFPPTGTVHIYIRGANNDLLEYVNDYQVGHVWNTYDLTYFGYGSSIGTDPSALEWGGIVHVYAGYPPPMGGAVMGNISQVPNTPYTTSSKVVALTFDDGPSAYTEQILQTLVAYRAPASFQIVGYEGAQNPSILQQESDEGFALVNHTWDHVDLTRLSPAGWVNEVDATDNLLSSITHRPASCLRPPYGYTNGSVVSQLAARGLGELMWDVDPSDYLRPGTSVIVQRVLGALHPGAIIAMHDGGGDRSQTAAALPAIITGIRQAGYSIVEVCG
jgi:peptidoglycan-N-acetylglucosamine deacetylase